MIKISFTNSTIRTIIIIRCSVTQCQRCGCQEVEGERGVGHPRLPVQRVRRPPGPGDGLQDCQVQELHQDEQEDSDQVKNFR